MHDDESNAVPLLRVHLEDEFFSDFSFTNALLLSEKQSRHAAPEDSPSPSQRGP